MNADFKRIFFICSLVFLTFISRLSQAYEILPRISKIERYPCTKCHKSYKIGLVEIIEGKEHPNLVFQHMPEVKNCSLCHDSRSPDRLNLLTGVSVSFNEESRLCGQCHGKIEYSWSLGQHGRLGGKWSGVRTQLSCAACHNPHRPKFQPMNSIMLPHQSEFVIKKGEIHEH